KVLKKVGPFSLFESLRDLVEDITTKQKPTSVQTFLGIMHASAKLEVMTTSGSFIVDGQDESIWGDNRIRLLVPCRFRYIVDLKKIKESDIRLDQNRRVLMVRMPPVLLDEPVPDREEMQTLESRNPLLRSSRSLYELRDRVLAEQLKPRAR